MKTKESNKVNILAELERVGYSYEPTSQDEVKILCPVHKDSNPSCSVNVEVGKWFCHSCKAKGDSVSLLCHILKCDRKTMLVDLASRYELSSVKSISLQVVEKHHRALWDAGPLLKELYNRGITDDLIRKSRLGYNRGRITIPVFDKAGRVINVRKYLPGAPGSEKMRNTRGMTPSALYQVEQTGFDTIWICGGEMKALAASKYLYDEAIGAIAFTGGEGNWNKDFNPLLKDKLVYICMDVDRTGKEAAKRLATQIYYSCKKVKIITLPLDEAVHPKGDLNDWIVESEKSFSDFRKLMDQSDNFFLNIDDEVDEGEIIDVRLSEVCSADLVGRATRCEGIVSALDENPYLIPKDIEVICSKDQKNCLYCPVWPKDVNEEKGCVPMTIKSSSSGILGLVNSPNRGQEELIKTALRIPACKACELKVVGRYNVLDVRLIPPLKNMGSNSDHIILPAFVVGGEIELNTPYTLTGRIFPDPKTQQSVFLISEVEQGEDSLLNFNSDNYLLSPLTIFQPKEWTVSGLEDKLSEIYDDLEANVTRIYKRRELHLALDLCYHSSLYFNFDDRVQNGWVNTLVLGDSSQGKSETALRLIEFYGVGVRNDCKNATVAGLLGGLQQMGTRWFVSWGVIPIHDRRLVVLEEVKGTPHEVLGKLTDMRSSGIAEVAKIEKRRSHARTRLVFISNPRSDRPISAYNFGVEAIKELMGALEDVRRFDMAVILSSTQIDSKEINVLSTTRKQVSHKHSGDLSKRLVLRAWTRTENDIVFEEEAVHSCLKYATKLCNEFTEVMPLCDRGTMRYKLARLSIGLANRTFSTVPDNMAMTLVRSCHVKYIYKYLQELYSDQVFGYKDFTKAQEFTNRVSDPKLVEKKLLSSKHPKDLVQQLLHSDEISLADIQDWCELERDDAQKFMSFLVRKHAIYRVKRYYVKTSEFITLLKKMRDSGVLMSINNNNYDRSEEF